MYTLGERARPLYKMEVERTWMLLVPWLLSRRRTLGGRALLDVLCCSTRERGAGTHPRRARFPGPSSSSCATSAADSLAWSGTGQLVDRRTNIHTAPAQVTGDAAPARRDTAQTPHRRRRDGCRRWARTTGRTRMAHRRRERRPVRVQMHSRLPSARAHMRVSQSWFAAHGEPWAPGLGGGYT
jgi:hypothetical protein